MVGAAHLAPLGPVRPRSGIGSTLTRGRSWRTSTTRCELSATSAPSPSPGRSRKTSRPARCKPTGKPWTGLGRRRTIGSLPPLTAGRCCSNILKILKVTGSSTDYEVVKLHATTVDGHRLVTLRLRTGPEVKGRDRGDFTFVFDADDLFVVRSTQFGEPGRDVGAESRFEYDHPDGRPVLRSCVRTVPAQHQTLRLDVEECRFGPIPEAEFALEPFLASLGPDRPNRRPAVEPSTATPLDWYWLAFVVGGINLAGGSGLALASRYRDRRAQRSV